MGGSSGGRFEGVLVAECLKLAEVGACLALRAEAVAVDVRAEVVVASLRVGQQVPDDDQDGAADRDESVLCGRGGVHDDPHGAAGLADRSSSAARHPRRGRRPGQGADDVRAVGQGPTTTTGASLRW